MAIELHQWTAALYLLASVAAAAGLGVGARGLLRASVVLLALGGVLHGSAFFAIHELVPTPALTELPLAVSLTAWIGTTFYLLLLLVLRVRILALAVLVAPLSFCGAFFASLELRAPRAASALDPLWSHLHVLLASGGLGLVGVAAAAGVLYVVHHQAIKSKRPGSAHSALPSLETLDRVNRVSLLVGFLLLSLSLVTGVAWTRATTGALWLPDWHANATLGCWMVYAAAVGARYVAGQGARRSAISSAVAFGLLLVVVVGVRAAA